MKVSHSLIFLGTSEMAVLCVTACSCGIITLASLAREKHEVMI